MGLARAYTPIHGRQMRGCSDDMEGIKLHLTRQVDPITDRAAPTWVICEPWALAAELTGWIDPATNLPGTITEAFIRAWVDQQWSAGYKGIYIKYVEIFGRWFYRPVSLQKWVDGDTLNPGADWSTFNSLNDDFDLVSTIVDQSRVRGLMVALSAGRVGFMGALSQVEVGASDSSPSAYAGYTVGQLKKTVWDRTRQLIADINEKFADYPNVVAYASGFEPGGIHVVDVIWPNLTRNTLDNDFPSMRSHGKQVWITCAALYDLPSLTASVSVREAYAGKMRNSGAHLWIQQDAVGPGYDYANGGRYTGCPSLTISQLPDFYAKLNAIANVANAAADNSGSAVEFAAMPESWRNGENPDAAITLSALSGANITITRSSGSWPSNIVGRWITTDGGGRGKVLSRSSDSVLIVSTLASSSDGYTGAPYEGVYHAQNTAFAQQWAIVGDAVHDAFYGWAIPAPGIQYEAQINAAARFGALIFNYAGSSFAVGDDLPLSLPQTKSGVSDYRGRANSLFRHVKRLRDGASLRHEVSRTSLPRVFQFAPTSSGVLSGGLYNNSPFKYYPRFNWTKASISVQVGLYRGETVNGYVNDVSIQMLINGYQQGPLQFVGGKNGVFSCTVELNREYAHLGLPFTIGAIISYQVVSGHPTMPSFGCTVIEYADE